MSCLAQRDETLSPRALALAAVASLALPGASAQAGPSSVSWLGPPGGRPAMTQEDVAREQAAVDRLLQGRGIGVIERWRSASSGDAGEVVLVRSISVRGRPCRTLRYQVRFASQPDPRWVFGHDWCRMDSGAWKIVEGAQ